MFKRHVAIVTALDDLSASPSIVNAIQLLVEAGYQVDVIARRFQGFMPDRMNWGVNVCLYLSPWNTRKGIPGLIALRHLLLIIQILWTHRPVAVIAISPETLVLAGPVAALFGLPLIHFSLEIRYPTNWVTHVQKWIEKFIYRFVWFTIIQDEVRAKAMLDSNDMDRAEMVFVPNSSGLFAPRATQNSYLRERWKISPQETVILCAGQISQMTMSLELALVGRKWPQNWRLIIHGWSGDPLYLEEVRAECDGLKVILSEETVPYERLDELVSSADIGIALYSAVDQNILNMGRSSGKIWQYLRCGLPVVTVDFPTLKQMMYEGEFGLCVCRPDDLEQAINKILKDRTGYSTRATDYYRHYGDFATHFKVVIDRLETL